ncbi:MAG: ATP-binding protein, partial [Gaiellaceae bacterium]
LNLYGEFEYSLPPLSLPDLQELPALESLAQLEAVALFVERARAVRPEFELCHANAAAVAQICTRLDGLPLAIELAAARIRALTPEAILARLEKRLELLTGGPRDVHARQRTLRDTIGWSYGLLPPIEKALFARLAVFAGGCSVAAAEQVACQDLAIRAGAGLASLAEKNILRPEDTPDGEPRFGMLETIREFALEQLAASGQDEASRQRHARFFLEVAEDGGPNLRGAERSAWLEQLDRELENLRAALAWSASEAGDAETGLRLAASLLTFWTAHGFISEGAGFLAALLARSEEPSVGRARALAAASMLAFLEGEVTKAGSISAEAGELARRLDERWSRATALNVRGTAARLSGDFVEARRLYHEALEVTASGELWWPAALAWANLGNTAFLESRYQEAAEILESNVQLLRDGGDGFMTAGALSILGRALRHLGELDRASGYLEEALALFLALRNSWGVATCLDAFAALAAARGENLAAARLFGAEEEMRQRAGIAMWRTIQADHEGAVEAVTSALGDDVFEQARAEGRRVTQAEAVACAREQARHRQTVAS